MADKKMENKIKITIEVKPNGDFSNDHAVCHATEGDRIAWTVNGNWAVLFTGGTPLNSVSFSGQAGDEIYHVVRSRAPGIYHYAVAVAIGKNVFLDAGCPTIVIN